MDLYRDSLRGPFQDFDARKGWQDRWVDGGGWVGGLLVCLVGPRLSASVPARVDLTDVSIPFCMCVSVLQAAARAGRGGDWCRGRGRRLRRDGGGRAAGGWARGRGAEPRR